MTIRYNHLCFPILGSLVLLCAFSCARGSHTPSASVTDDSTSADIVSDSAATEVAEPEPNPDPYIGTGDSSSIINYLNNCDESSQYAGGVLYSMAKEAPEYAKKILRSQFDRFIVVDKASMRVILYNKYGQIERAYDMACAKNFGNKHKKADSRTPEGFFSVEGIYDSTDWLFTDDEGVTSKKKGQFGPRFIRLRIPTTSQIGIHGTCSPWSIGHRTSHGCIRITNENILELVELVEPGMPAIVLPGKKDRAVNREEGTPTLYFPTAAKYAKSAAEKKEDQKPFTPKEEDSSLWTDTISTDIPSEREEHKNSPDSESITEQPTDSI